MTTRCCSLCSAPIPDEARSDKVYCSNKCASRVRNKRYAKLHPELLREKRLRENSEVARRMHIRVKSRAKTNNIPFNLDVSDIQVPEVCPVLGIRLVPNHGRQGYFVDSPSLDRIIPALGYVKGNIRVISARANLLKNDASVEELEKVLADLKKLQQ